MRAQCLSTGLCVGSIGSDCVGSWKRAGDVSCLPTKSNCWGILRKWKMNMPGLRCRLEDLFPLGFPEVSLVGKNHRSLPDTHMLRKTAFRFSQLVPRRSGGNRDNLVGVLRGWERWEGVRCRGMLARRSALKKVGGI